MTLDAPSSSPVMQLTIETTHPDPPRLDLWTIFRTKRLADIYA
jgi:hypothetical protein